MKGIAVQLRADSASGYRFTAIATLSAAVAGLAFLSGLLDVQLRALIAVRALPSAEWSHHWSRTALEALTVQAFALDEWLQLVLVLMVSVLLLAGVSALVSLFAHATARRYETALAAVVGASRRQLIRAQLRQAAVNAGFAVLLGAPIGLAAAFIAQRSWPHHSQGMSALAWLAMGTLFCCVLAALVARSTAGRMARAGWLGDVLAPEARSNPGHGAEDLRAVLLHVQFAFAFALVTVALLVWQHAATAGAGSAASGADAYVTRVDTRNRPGLAELLRAERQLEEQYTVASPGALIGVGKLDHVIANCGRCVMANMILPLFRLRTQQHVVGNNFFETIGHGLIKGRDFLSADAARHHIIVNDTFASLAFQGQDAIGRQVQVGGINGTWYTVVGVVSDMPIAGLHAFRPDEASVVRNNRAGRELAIYFYTGEKPPAVFDVISKRPPTALPFKGMALDETLTMAALLADARAPAQWFANVLGGLATTVAIVAMLSLAAITLLNVRQRELEIAARRAVGARRADILRLILQDTVGTVARGSLIGVILSIGIARAAQMILPQMQVVDVRLLVMTACALTLISLAAALTPARIAAAIPPARVHA